MTQADARRAPEFVRAIIDRALALFQQGRFDSAEVLLATIAADETVKPMVLHLRGLTAMHLGQKERAQQFLQEAIRANPTDCEAHANLGLLLLETRRHPQAAAAYAAALTLDPRNPAWHFGLAKALAGSGLSDLAIDSYRDACSRAPDYADAEIDLASLLSDCGESAEAIALLRHALTRHPDRADLHMALAFCLLAIGDWPAGWKEYEWRWSDPSLGEKPLPSDRPFWQGEDLSGRTILLQCEQGFGEILQFARYAPVVKARGAEVILRAPTQLLPLLKSVAGVDALIDVDEAAPAFDVHAPLLSLPGVFGARIDAIPECAPYLAADPALVEGWRERLGAHSGLSIGLCWQDNPAHSMDQFRSMRLEVLRPLLGCPGTRFISLQIGPGQDQLTGFEGQIIEPKFDGAGDSFADTAAIIANLDLVIGVDSAVVHLAGALGKPAWILLAARADWRWLRERNDTPWYPQAKLYRQETLGDWDEVVGWLRTDLWELAGASPPAKDAIADSARSRRRADPSLCDALFMEGVRHHRANDLGRSKKLFERVLALDPQHVSGLCNLGALERSIGGHHRARDLLERAVSLAPEHAPARLALADTLLAGGDSEAAIAHYRRACAFAPKSDAVHAAFAMALEDLGDHDAAMAHFELAAKINQRQSPEFFEALGRASLARGNLQGAEISFQHALALHPKFVTAHCGLGDVYLSLGRRVDAGASFRRALDIDRGSSAAHRGLERLRLAAI
ncbi:MAG: tetratricopeptide repeat protein [Methylocella sp.]